MNIDKKYMAEAIKLAKRGRGWVSPNPLVGAIIVKKGKIIGKGYHAQAGLPHAEVVALKKAGPKARGGTLYVNLEPCNHFGKTPPCTTAIIKSGIKKVVIAMQDPNPLNSGRGTRHLKRAGIQVEKGVMKQEAQEINLSFLKFITEGKPFVTLKAALSLDGKIATRTGKSKWITGEKARKYVQEMRRETDAILVGINTVYLDNPRLTVRDDKKREKVLKKPIRIVLDSRARLPLDARILRGSAKTLVAVTPRAGKNKIKALENKGAQVLTVDAKEGKVDFVKLVKKLGKLGLTNLLIEGGGEINASALTAGVVDKVIFFIAPRIIGGRSAPTAVGGEGILEIKKSISIENFTVKKIGNDFVMEGYPRKCSPG